MPELNKIVSAILRDVAEARSISDAYSKDIAVKYATDPLMKFFPVPRADIKEMSFDLKFAIGSIEEDPNRRQAKDSKLKSLPDKYSSEFLSEAKSFLKMLATQNSVYKDALDNLNQNVKSTNLKTEIARELSGLISNPGNQQIADDTIKNHLNKIFYKNVSYPFRFHEFDVFEISGGKGEYGIQLTADDGKPIIKTTQKFGSRREAFEAIQLLVENPEKHVNEKSENGKGTFTLIDASGKERIKNAEIEISLPESELKRLKLSKGDALSKIVAAKFRSGVQTFESVSKAEFPVDNPLHDEIDRLSVLLKKRITEEAKAIESEPGEMKLDVLMTPELLQKIPETAISTFRFSVDMKNHTISDDGDKQNLIPL